MRKESAVNKSLLARELGVSRRSLYYHRTKPPKDWLLKCRIEEALREHPSYGHRRLALHLHLNRKRIRRVMRLFGIKPYRRRGRKPFRIKGPASTEHPNLLMGTFPACPKHIWVSDFTYLPFKGRFLYLATVMDLFTREIVGMSVLTAHTTQLTLNALLSALQHHPHPTIFHSDNGREYTSYDFTHVLVSCNITVSRSKKGCPWENGYQESFYSQFKVELGDPGRFSTLGELVYEIYSLIYRYNHRRIHSALKMPPALFASKHLSATLGVIETR